MTHADPFTITDSPVTTGATATTATIPMQPGPGRTFLPYGHEGGVKALWTLQSGPTNQINVEATFLGIGSSHQSTHRNHDSQHATRTQHCNACRWFETRIFRVESLTSDPVASVRVSYLLHHVGMSRVPGETDYYRHEFAHSAHEVIEAYTVRKNGRDGQPQSPFLTRPSARAMSQAAKFDPELEDAWLDRTVA